ncbi:hypothetical protein GWI33_008914 [Rhynchophorus ferrugineus]|uniref:Uncharacterized protein n=1 Tax=Rhynchophorus ferrugineus TaxID=354439 RepID=A0A834J278_RHYFE|nr:hypothetical protein GWI33_008914 [Rhynchophorus ferrugineus]
MMIYFLLIFCVEIISCSTITKKFNSDKIMTARTAIDVDSLEEFVKLIEKFNMNFSIIASSERLDETNKQVEEIIVHMPIAKISVGQPILDDKTMEKYLNTIKDEPNIDNIAARIRIINIIEGNDKLKISKNINANYKMPSISYDLLTKYQDGIQGFHIPKNHSQQILYRIIINNSTSETPSYVDVIQTKINIKDINRSADFPEETLSELKKMLPELYLWIDDKDLLLRMLVEHLDRKFEHDHQAILGVDTFAFHNKPYVNLEIANTNVIVFLLKRRGPKIY